MPERVSYYTDEHVSKAIVRGLRNRGVDVLTCQEAQMLNASDRQHLEFSTLQKRVMFTQDTDFIRLHAAGHGHFGIVYAPQQMPIGKIISGLMLIWEVLDAEEMIGHVEYL